jgi:hypothetical protein
LLLTDYDYDYDCEHEHEVKKSPPRFATLEGAALSAPTIMAHDGAFPSSEMTPRDPIDPAAAGFGAADVPERCCRSEEFLGNWCRDR